MIRTLVAAALLLSASSLAWADANHECSQLAKYQAMARKGLKKIPSPDMLRGFSVADIVGMYTDECMYSKLEEATLGMTEDQVARTTKWGYLTENRTITLAGVSVQKCSHESRYLGMNEHPTVSAYGATQRKRGCLYFERGILVTIQDNG